MANFNDKERVLDLSEAQPQDDPLEVGVGAGEFIIVDVDATLYVRTAGLGGYRHEIESRERFCGRAGPFDNIYLDWPAASDGATATLVRTMGYTRELAAPPKGIQGPPGPRRLGGDLDPGTTVQAGEMASERQDVPRAERVRVRAKLSGMGALSHEDNVNTADINDVQGLALDPDRDLAFVVSDDDPTFVVLDVSDPTALAAAGTVDPGTGSDPAGYTGVAFTSAGGNSWAIAFGTDGQVYRFDVSDSTAPSFVDRLQLTGETGGTGDESVVVDPNRGTVATAYVSGGDNPVYAVDLDVTGGSGLTEVAVVSNGQGGAKLRIDPADARLVAIVAGTFNNFVRLFDISNPAAPLQLDDRQVAGLDSGLAINVDDDWVAVGRSQATGSAWEIVEYGAGAFSQSFEDAGFEADGAAFAGGVLFLRDTGSVLRAWAVPSADSASETGSVAQAAAGGFEAHVVGGRPTCLHDLNGITASRNDPGADTVQVVPILSDGTRAETGRSAKVEAQDGLPVLIDLDVVGADAVDVDVQANGPNDSQVDYIELAQE